MCRSKLRNLAFLEKCLKWNLSFQNWLKKLSLSVSEPTKPLAAQMSMQHTSCVTDTVNKHLPRKKKDKKKKKQKQKKPLKIDSGTGVFLLILQKF